MRQFGQSERDLAVDFSRPPPVVAVEVLAACAAADGGPGRDFFSALPVGSRIACLLGAADWGPRGAIELDLACQDPACKKAMEIALPVQALADWQSRTDPADCAAFRHGGEDYVLRRPTGDDQLAWLARGLAGGERQAAWAMARSLLVAGGQGRPPGLAELGEDWIESAGKALEALDPLVDFRVDTACPECGGENHFDLDLEALCLRRLQAAQRDLLGQVHTLAKNYHWSEAQIFAVPSWRRAHYLRLIAKE